MAHAHAHAYAHAGEPMAARAQHAATATPDGRFVFIFGGYSGEGAKCFNDLWLLDVEAFVFFTALCCFYCLFPSSVYA